MKLRSWLVIQVIFNILITANDINLVIMSSHEYSGINDNFLLPNLAMLSMDQFELQDENFIFSFSHCYHMRYRYLLQQNLSTARE